MSNDCEKVSYTICGHTYQFWCKKDKIDTANYIFDKIAPIIEKNHSKNTGFSFDKILLMSLIDMMVKDNDRNNQKITTPPQFTLDDDKEQIMNEVVEVLEVIKKGIS